MKLDLFGKKKAEAISAADDAEVVETDAVVDGGNDDSMDEMQKVARTISEIKKQNPLQALLSGSKNERALAENDALISSVIKNILNWLAVITSAETVRKEEYEELTSQMVQLDEDVNAQLEMQVKFKKAYESMMQKQEEQKSLTEKVEKLQKENLLLKVLAGVAIGVACLALIVALI